MPRDKHFMTMERADEETEVTVEYTFYPGCAATMYGDSPHPGDDPEVDIAKVTLLNGVEVKDETDAEMDSWRGYIMENHEGHEPDGDYLRDQQQEHMMQERTPC